MDQSSSFQVGLAGRLLIIGTGCIASAVLPLLWRHVSLQRDRVTLLGPDPLGQVLAYRHGISFHACRLTRDNFALHLATHLAQGDVLLNLALDVGSLDLIDWCQRHGVIYLDTNLEPWKGSTFSVAIARQHVLSRGQQGCSTAVVSHGANPGLVSHFVKQALRILSPESVHWPDAAIQLGLQVVVVSEYDNHITAPGTIRCDPDQREFANTWSPRGLAGELCARAELGWGGHENFLPPGARRHGSPARASLELKATGAEMKIRSWSPGPGMFEGHLLAHHESISIADMLTPESSAVTLRPTVFYAVRPCNPVSSSLFGGDALRYCENIQYKALGDEILGGGIELGVLLLGARLGYWFGSCLSIDLARKCAPDNNATTLQVAAGVLGGLIWALENPRQGIVEAEDIDHRRILSIASPYLGRVEGIITNWRPKSAVDLQFEDFLAPA